MKDTKRSALDLEKAETPLVDDIRLLGRILGDIIRDKEGKDVYDLVERVRKLSVSFHKDTNQSANNDLAKLLKGLTSTDAMKVLRAFTYFSHLANLAEDRHHVRRRIAYERLGKFQDGSISVALNKLQKAGITNKIIN